MENRKTVIFAEGETEYVYRTERGKWSSDPRKARVYPSFDSAKRAQAQLLRRFDWDRFHTIGCTAELWKMRG